MEASAFKEYHRVRQIPGEPRRRWFTSDDFDLIVWFDTDDAIAGFELCYDKAGTERSILWRPATGFAHMAVDAGENRPGCYKSTPILSADGDFDAPRIHAAFNPAATSLPVEIADYVGRCLEGHPNFVR